jgi:pSer/pThr/pTyr-binding forkhead associated (FHA) protein
METDTRDVEPDYYAIIGVARDATPEEIRRVYGEKIREAQSDTERFSSLSTAYEILKDTAKRAAYDRRQALIPQFPESTAMIASNPTAIGFATQQIGTPPPNGISLPSVCAMDLSACPLRSGSPAIDENFCAECGYLLGSPLGDLPRSRPLPKFVDVQGREFPLKLGENIVGRENADVVIPHNTVSRRHSRILVDDKGMVSLEDMGSTNGTRVASIMIPKHQRTGLQDRMVVQFGGVKLTLIMPVEEDELLALPEVSEKSQPLPAIAAPEGDTTARLIGITGVVHVLMADRTTFGRRAGNTVIISDDSYISGNHAEIVYKDGSFILTDLGSTNGTKLNGARLPPNRPEKLKNGDAITMGQTEYTFRGPAS